MNNKNGRFGKQQNHLNSNDRSTDSSFENSSSETVNEQGSSTEEEHDPTWSIIIFLALTIGIGIPVGRLVGIEQNKSQEAAFVKDRVSAFQQALDDFQKSKGAYPFEAKEVIPDYMVKMIGLDYKTRFVPSIEFSSYTSSPTPVFSLKQKDCTVSFKKVGENWRRSFESMHCNEFQSILDS